MVTRIGSWLDRLARRDPPPGDTEAYSSSSLASMIVSTELQAYSYPRRALVVAAVYRARQLTADTIASVPLEPPVPAPNRDQDLQGFVTETILSLLDHGEAYWRYDPRGNGDLTVERYADVTVEWNASETRRLYTDRGGARMRTSGPARNLIVLSINRSREDLRGTGPMESPRIRGLIAEQQYSQEFYENAATPSGTLTHPGMLTKDEAQRIRKQWEDAHAKRTTAVLAGGIEYKPLSFSPQESEWVEGHMAGIGDVANLFGVPGELLNYNQSGSSLTYKNIGSVFEEFWRTTAHPTYASRIEAALTDVYASQVAFDPRRLFLASMADRTNAAGQLVRSGYDPVGVLEVVGLPAIDHSGHVSVTLYPDDSEGAPDA